MKNIIKKALQILLSFILFFATTTLLFTLPIQSLLKKENLNKTINHLEIEKMTEENPYFQKSIDTILKPVYEKTQELKIDKKLIIKLIDTKEIKSLTADIAYNIIDYIKTKENQKLIQEKDIENLIENALQSITQNSHYTLTTNQKNVILTIVKAEINRYQDKLPNTNIIDKKISPTTFFLLHNIVNKNLPFYLLGIILLSIIAIWILKNKEKKTLKKSLLCSTLFTSFIYLILFILSYQNPYFLLFILRPYILLGMFLSLILSIPFLFISLIK